MNINIRLTMIDKSMINNSIRSTYEALILLSTLIFDLKILLNEVKTNDYYDFK